MIGSYENVLSYQVSLPPPWELDHSIPLIPRAFPVKVRSYWYSFFQMTEIEKQVATMLDTGIITHSHSSFASPVLLLRNKDGSWRLCVDYSQLNAITIKDKFPIPTVDDFLDELQGAAIFSQFDLRLGYHQILVKPEDAYKTAFRTHHGHFEFIVMTFDLTNPHTTF